MVDPIIPIDAIDNDDWSELEIGLLPANEPFHGAAVDLRDDADGWIQFAVSDIPRVIAALQKAQDLAAKTESGDRDG